MWQTKNNLNLKQCGTYNRVQTLIVTQTSKRTQNSDSTNGLKAIPCTRLLLTAITDLKEPMQRGVNLVFRKCVTCARFT